MAGQYYNVKVMKTLNWIYTITFKENWSSWKEALDQCKKVHLVRIQYYKIIAILSVLYEIISQY